MTNIPTSSWPVQHASYFDSHDTSAPLDLQCTGDNVAWGASGTRSEGGTPCTDPTLPGAGCTTNKLMGRRTYYYAQATLTSAQARALAINANTPLTATGRVWTPTGQP